MSQPAPAPFDPSQPYQGAPHPQAPTPPPPPAYDVDQRYATPAGPPYPAQPYAQPYSQPYAQPYAGSGLGTNTMAVVALVSAVLGLSLLPLVGSIAAVIIGPMARREIARTGQEGGGLATAGIVIGWIGVGLVGLGLLAAIAIPFILTARVATG